MMAYTCSEASYLSRNLSGVSSSHGHETAEISIFLKLYTLGQQIKSHASICTTEGTDGVKYRRSKTFPKSKKFPKSGRDR